MGAERKTQCIRGHEYTAENTYVQPSRPNTRICLLCRSARQFEQANGLSKPQAPLAELFYSHVTIGDAAACWRWTGAPDRYGYGRLKFCGRMMKAHRVAYELNVGPIPDGLTIDHVKARGCSTTLCVNPSHLEPVTCRVNLLRGNTHAAKNAAKTHCPKGHPYADHLTTGRYPQRQCLPCGAEQVRRSRARRTGVLHVGEAW